ncbi:MAG: phosphoenolpyruvate mutase [Rhodospirillales bacterium]|nr:phosphoenolpyruvate mutase [Rhodospirillales bacterium]
MNHSPSVSKTRKFRDLLVRKELAFLMEAHDGLSARIVEEAGFEGIWGSGLSISTALGVRDRNEASWTQVLEVVEFMAESTSIPILLDGDTGYGDFNNFRRLVTKLIQRGIAAVCIEDKVFPKTNSFIENKQPLAEIAEFAGKIKAGKDSQTDADFCIIARVEALIAGHGMAEALKRAEAYRQAGADGILIHSKKSSADEILTFAKEWANRAPLVIVPTKYYATPTEHFRQAGISTIIWANHNLRSAMQAMRETSRRIFDEQSLINVEGNVTPLNDVFEITGDHEIAEAEKRYLPGKRHDAGAIVLAASRGKSLEELTREKPKCMLDIRGRPLLDRQVAALNNAGISRIAVVGGYKAETITVSGITLVTNRAWESTGELASLATAADLLEGTCLVSYGDIYFRDFVAQILLDTEAEVAIAVDWTLARGQGRAANSRDLCRCTKPYSTDPFHEGATALAAIGTLAPDQAHGEWIGVAAFTPKGSEKAKAELQRMRAEGGLDQASMPDLFNRLVAGGTEVRVKYIGGNWCNVNDAFDLANLRNML